MTISLNQFSSVGQLNFDYKGNVLLNDEVYLRMKVKPRVNARGAKYLGSQFYVHDSMAHVRRDLNEKRYLMSRDVGSKYYPMVEGASYRFQIKDPKEGEQDYILAFSTGTRSNGVGYVEDGMIDFGIGRNVNNDDFKGLPDGTLDSSIQELTFSVSLYKTKDIMGLNQYFDGSLARKNYEINHLDKSSPIISVSISNYLVDVETGSFESYGPMTDIGHPLKCNVSFFKQSPAGKDAPAEIIEIKQEKSATGAK